VCVCVCGGEREKTSMHYKVLFITKSIMETEYDILMTAIRLQQWKSVRGVGETEFRSKKCNRNCEFNGIL